MNKTNEPIRVLHVVTHLNRNGLESRIMDIYRNIDRTQIQFDFMLHCKDNGHYGEEAELLGANLYHMPRISPLYFIKYLTELDKFFKQHREIKIVHAHLNTLSTWVLLVAKRNGVKVRIAHSRNSSMECNLRAIPKRISKLFINKFCTDRFACSKIAGIWLFGEKEVEKDTFHVIPNAFQIDKFVWNNNTRKSKREELRLKDDELVFVDVSRFSDQKNHVYLLKIFEEILKLNNKSKLLLVGCGENENKIKTYINQHNLNETVILLGSRTDVSEIYQASDLFLFPTKYEGFGTVVIEAQMTNLPVIAGDTIPYETKLCDSVVFKSIKLDPSEWAQAAVEVVKKSIRCDNTNVLRRAGYDIREQYKWIENFYKNALE